jgi:hypothetical protein
MPLRRVTRSAAAPTRRTLGVLGAGVIALGAACSSTIAGSSGGDGAAANGASGPAAGGTSGASGSAQGNGGTKNGGSTSTGGASPGSGGTSSAAGTGTHNGGGAGSAGASALEPLFPNPPAFAPAAGMLRRLTRTQFRNAVRDVFGVEVDTSELDADSWDGNSAVIGAAKVVTSELGVEQYQTAIEGAVDAVFTDATARAAFIGCTPVATATDACVRGFLQRLGTRAWRRALDTTELDRLAALAQSASTALGSAVEGVRWATVALFTSPNFLYRPELGAPSADGSLRFTGYEMASRLAFLVWNSLPDQALLDQAASGALGTEDGIRSAVERLLDAPAGREAASAFAEEFLRLDRIATQAKDPKLYADYSTALQRGMVRDIRDTWAVITFDDGASVLDLFSTPKVVVNQELAALYGLDTAGLTSTTFQVRSLPADGPRLGLLSKAGFLSEFANQKEGSPTLRGRYMQEQLLCNEIPPPPPDVNTMLPEPPANTPMTKRDRLALHREAVTCAGCHNAMDPLGLPLESFDAIGRYRTTDNGLPIDPSGNFDEVAVADARELGAAVGTDPAVANCILRRYYAYATGHVERDVDGIVLNTLASSFTASGWKLRDLVVAIATHDAFSTVAPQP